MKRLLIFIIIFCVLFGFSTAQIQAADGMTLSLTPPLIKNNVNPGQIWRSAIKVINNNPSLVNIYLEATDFKSGNDSGTVEFIKAPETANQEENKYLLSQWIVIEPGPIEIPAFGSVEVPFIIDVPETAGPGGHYAAVLAGTKPSAEEISGTNIKISSLLASLILLNVNGEVKEEGRIREFSANKKIFYEPNVNFTVRFENLGNVHIQPQGEIKVYNFFNKQKELITLNHNSEFGNVLPGGIRKWNFSWTSEKSLLEMGRYRAELVLSYGETAKETVDQKIFFWIIYPKPLIIALSVLLLLILIIVLITKRYIKKSIIRTQSQYGLSAINSKINAGKKQEIPIVADSAGGQAINIKSKNQALDLKAVVPGSGKPHSSRRGWGLFKRIMGALFIIAFLILIGILYLNYRENYGPKIRNEQSNIEKLNEDSPKDAAAKADNAVSPKADDNGEKSFVKENTGTSTAVIGESIDENGVFRQEEAGKEDLSIRVLNGSGQSGAADKAADLLEEYLYAVASIANADNFNYNNSIVKYKKGLSQDASLISKIFSEAPDLQELEEQAEDIVVIIGKNFLSAD
ncbi:MAG: LytR C-terminal domain-containing protein [Patescibacteria group bacterium]|nr:LytR C-terminal domain-containing protein [Patescibacteria group bacterium]